MFLLPLLFSLASLSLCAFAVDILVLQKTLAEHNVSAVYQTDKNYSNVTQAFNRRFTVTPVAVVFPTSVAQVSAAVVAGAKQKLEVAARSGGHSYIANGLGGNNGSLVIDMSKMKNINVGGPSDNFTAVIETGNRLGDVALALNAHGRALPHGTCSYVGTGGHIGYGGFGFTSRAWGLALDTVKSATVVLADGIIATASESVNQDLFWAIRGSSPSFGIVTSFEVQTFPAPPSATVFNYTWNSMDITTAAKSISNFQTFVKTNIPPEFGAELTFTAGPKSGTVKLMLIGGYYAAITEGELDKLMEPYFKNLPTPSNKTFTSGLYINSVAFLSAPQALDTSLAPDRFDTFYVKSLMTPEKEPMSDKAITAFATWMSNEGFKSTTDWFVQVELYGGNNSAINAVPLESTAFAKRDTLFTIQFYASSSPTNKSEPFPAAGFLFLDGMVKSILDNERADWDYGLYLNYIDDMLSDATKLRYYGPHYQRLTEIKHLVDPENTFRFPVGVGPHGGAQISRDGAQTPFSSRH